MGKTIFTCTNCHKEFPGQSCHKKGDHIFCCQKCYADFRKSKHAQSQAYATGICQTCGKTFMYLVYQKKFDAIFCSNKCYHKYRKTLKPPNYIEDQVLINALQIVNQQANNNFLTPALYDSFRKKLNFPAALTIRRRFVTWEAALAAAELPTEPTPDLPIPVIRRNHKCSNKKLLTPCTVETAKSDLLRVYNIIGQTPTLVQYKKYGIFPWTRVSMVLTGQDSLWAESCKMAGLVPHTTHEGSGNGLLVQYVTPSKNVVTLQSSYEERFAIVLDRWKENWICHRELSPIKFKNKSGKTSNYRPDFYLPDRDIYLDTKGWLRPECKTKLNLVHESNPNLTLYLVFKEPLKLAEQCSSFDEWFDLSITQNLLGQLPIPS